MNQEDVPEKETPKDLESDKPWLTDPSLTPRVISVEGRVPRFGLGKTNLSPYIMIDGKVMKSSLNLSKKDKEKKVNFPVDSLLVKEYPVPEENLESVSREDLIFMYEKSCDRHGTNPLESVITQLKENELYGKCQLPHVEPPPFIRNNIDLSAERSSDFILKGQILDRGQCESLEEIFKKVHFKAIDLENTSLDDESAVALFEMFEYYNSVERLNVSCNPKIGSRGWITFSHLIKTTKCLNSIEARSINIDEPSMHFLGLTLRYAGHLRVLKLDNCGLSGEAVIKLTVALRSNVGLKELYLTNNRLCFVDAKHLGTLLRINTHLRLLDISNNELEDKGVEELVNGLLTRPSARCDSLAVLSLWNNQLTEASLPSFCKVLERSKCLETLNVGKNNLRDDFLSAIKDSLINNRALLHLGLQSTNITCQGVHVLIEILQVNETLRRIDLRDNIIQTSGMAALLTLMKSNKNITQLDIDEKPSVKIDCKLSEYRDFLSEIRECCMRNAKDHLLTENDEGDSSGSQDTINTPCRTYIRKISLTCHLLPPAKPISVVEPVCLRAIPSTIPSHVTNTISTPSRNRFLVSRVHEMPVTSISGITV